MQNDKSLLTGIMIIAGTTIGAGMFSLPVVSSGMWFIWSVVCLIFLWFYNYLSALYILEANVQFAPGASFDTLTRKLLGKAWNIAIGISVAFLMYILLYAYFSAFGNIVSKSLGWEILQDNQWYQGAMSLALGCILALIVWYSTALVGRISTLLVIGMIITFIISMSGYTMQIDPQKLFNSAANDTTYFPYLWAALPYFMTSFGFSAVVPSLYKYYGKQPSTIIKSLLGGSILAVLVYILFIMVAFGNIARHDFIAVNEAGGNIGHLLAAFESGTDNTTIGFILNLFSNFAIITSFLGVGLGLFDFIADKFSLDDDKIGRLKTACLTFIPPGVASFFFPNGFILAIGYAGLVAIIVLGIAPFLMVRKVRANKTEGIYKVWGGKTLLVVFLFTGLLIAACKILTIIDYLPKW